MLDAGVPKVKAFSLCRADSNYPVIELSSEVIGIGNILH